MDVNNGDDIIPNKGTRTGYYLKCENCGKDIYQTKTQYGRAKHHFCSNKCQKEFQHILTFEDRICPICGKTFSVSKKSTQKLCSTDCQKIWQTQQIGTLNPKFSRKETLCETCGQKYYVKNYKLMNGQHNFCSNSCRRKWYSDIWSQTDDWKEESRIRATKILSGRKIDTNSKPQIIINELLNLMHVDYINEKEFVYYSADNYLVNYNLVIEIMGDYWHCNPNIFTSPINETQKNRIIKDKAKRTFLRNQYGIETLYLWESDIYENLPICSLLIDKYIASNGNLLNYNSFNYHISDDQLIVNESLIYPYFELTS